VERDRECRRYRGIIAEKIPIGVIIEVDLISYCTTQRSNNEI
jgi:hypothetical protein